MIELIKKKLASSDTPESSGGGSDDVGYVMGGEEFKVWGRQFIDGSLLIGLGQLPPQPKRPKGASKYRDSVTHAGEGTTTGEMAIVHSRPVVAAPGIHAKKRKAPEPDSSLEHSLGFSWENLSSNPSSDPVPGSSVVAKLLPRKYATGAFAGLYRSAPALALPPAADSRAQVSI